MRMRPLVAGLATYVPGLYERLHGTTGGSDSASYCYGVWLKHLSIAAVHGLDRVPRVVAELGPGDSLGVGLAAMLSGTDRYLAFDVLEYAANERNQRVLEELHGLLSRRAGTPDREGWPPVGPYLDDAWFPSGILTEQALAESLAPERVTEIRAALGALDQSPTGEVELRYVVPWADQPGPPAESVDLILSHSVMEHVTDLPAAYAAMFRWLRPGGMVSHQIDFQSHALAEEWNGHWAFSDPVWRIIAGRRPYLLNREPWSVHEQALTAAGFEIVHVLTNTAPSEVPRSRLASRFRDLSEADLTCKGTLVQAVKPG